MANIDKSELRFYLGDSPDEAKLQEIRSNKFSTWWCRVGTHVNSNALRHSDLVNVLTGSSRTPLILRHCGHCKEHKAGVCDDHFEMALEDARNYREAVVEMHRERGEEVPHGLPAPSLQRAHAFLEDENMRRKG